MSNSQPDPISQCLIDLEEGDRSAIDRLLPHIYSDLRGLAGNIFRGGANHTLQPTVLVHEAYMRLVKGNGSAKGWTGRKHFLDVAAMAMRQLLANHAEARRTQKRGGDCQRVTLDNNLADKSSEEIDIVDLDDALTELARLDPRLARVVELRFLSGLTVDETAEVLDVSVRTVHTDWQMARRWLGRRLDAQRRES